MNSFVKGEVLVFTDHYDLFDVDMYKKEVMFYKYVSENTKCLVMYPKTGEWGEPKTESLQQKNMDMYLENMLTCVRELN